MKYTQFTEQHVRDALTAIGVASVPTDAVENASSMLQLAVERSKG